MTIAARLFKSVILGAPASGKGTISGRIVDTFHLHHISAGDKLRQHIQDDTVFGRKVKVYLDKGQLVPTSLMVEFIQREINSVGQKSWLLDGFPRSLEQAEGLQAGGVQLNVVLNLNVPFDVILERVKGRWVHLASGRVYNEDFNAPQVPRKDDVTGEELVKRPDDDPNIVAERLRQYEALTTPVIEFYRNKGILKEFSGRTSDEIWPQVRKYLAGVL